MELKNIKNKIIRFSIKKGKKTNNIRLYNKILYNLKKRYNKDPNPIISQSIIKLLPKILEKSYSKKKNIKFSNSKRSGFFIIPNKEKQLNKSIKCLFNKLIINGEKSSEIYDTATTKNSNALLLKKQTYKNLEKLKFK